ncbi:hypothetical protein [Rhizorhabdus argentea]|uniref:hypothetical protein n=1 Tax=Rhizorhabdus argentea TaxID=1387174 RepID=UPI0030EF1109
MRIKAVLVGAAALAATAIPAAAPAQIVSFSISSGHYDRGYYGSPYGYGYDYDYPAYAYGYGRAYPYRYDRGYRGWDRDHWDRGRHHGWRHERHHDRRDWRDHWDRD